MAKGKYDFSSERKNTMTLEQLIEETQALRDMNDTRKGECVHITEISSFADEDGVVKDNDEKVWWNEEKQDWESIDEAVARTKDDTRTDEENREWYRQRASYFEFHPLLTTCAYCGEREACYNGITSALTVSDDETYNGIIFQFCKQCRDELQMIKLQSLA